MVDVNDFGVNDFGVNDFGVIAIGSGAGSGTLRRTMPIGATAHQAGAIRFGADPATSALDLFYRTHEIDNLYVAHTSFIPYLSHGRESSGKPQRHVPESTESPEEFR